MKNSLEHLKIAETAKDELQYINEWRSESRSCSCSYRINRAKKIESWEQNVSVKILELDRNNSDVERGSNESDTDESSDSRGPRFEILISMHSFSAEHFFVCQVFAQPF